MGEVVPLFTDRRQSVQQSPAVLDEFLHHMKVMHGTDLQPLAEVPAGFSSARHELRARAESLHKMDHGVGMKRVAPHVHEA